MLTLTDARLTNWPTPQDQYHSLDRYTEEEFAAFLERQRESRKPAPPKVSARDISLAAKLLGDPPPDGSGLLVTLSLPQPDPDLPPLTIGPVLSPALPPLGQTFERTEAGAKAYYLLASIEPLPEHTALTYARIDKPAYQALNKRLRAIKKAAANG
jgi:hypothetical protein